MWFDVVSISKMFADAVDRTDLIFVESFYNKGLQYIINY